MKYKHVLFLNPYISHKSSAASVMGLFPPTGLEYIATSAKGLAGKITLMDLRYEKELNDNTKLADFVKKEIDFVCASITWSKKFDEACDILNALPHDVPLIVGGYKATEEVEKLFELSPNINIVVRGEGEDTIKDILNGISPENILGISYKKEGKVIHNANRPLPDVNKIAYPDRSLRRNSYRMSLGGINVTSLTYDTILSTRGCPFNCKFCTFSLNPLGQKRNYAARTVESVIQEIEEIDANMILFSDDNFFTDVKRAERICDLIIEKKIKKRFIAQARIDISKHPEVLAKSVKAGFKMLLLGIESPHNRILEQFNKGFDQAEIRKSFKVLTKYPIYYHGYFIYGNIGETKEEMLYISHFAREIGVDSIAYSRLRIDKFSPLREIAEKTPGYHVTANGELHSDIYDEPTMKKIRKRIEYSFYTPIAAVKLFRKIIIVRFFSFKEIISLLFATPFLLIGIIKREIYKGRFIESFKRVFFSSRRNR